MELRADPDKTKAVIEIKAPQSVSELKIYGLWLIELGKFSLKIFRTVATLA